MQEELSDVTECSICCEVFKNPRVLPCMHTFCLKCIQDYGKGKHVGDTVSCPICRKDFTLPSGGFEELQHNFFAQKVIDIATKHAGKFEEPKVTICDICSDGDVKPLATMTCVDCAQNMCDTCSGFHKRMKNSAGHQIVPIGSELKPETLKLTASYCTIHQGEVIKMFCHNCNEVICVLCFAENHQSHRCANIDKTANEFRSDLQGNSKKVGNRLDESKSRIEELDRVKLDLVEQVKNVEELIREKVEALKAVIDDHAAKLTAELLSIQAEKVKEIEMIKQDIEGFQVSVESYIFTVDDLLQKGNAAEVSKVSRNLITRAEELQRAPINGSGEVFSYPGVRFTTPDIENVCRVQNVNNMVGNVELILYGKQIDFSKVVEGVERIDLEGVEMEFPEDLRTILVYGIVTGSEETVQIYFESTRKGGGKIELFEYNPDDGSAYITFEDEKVATLFLELGEVTIHDMNLVISKPIYSVLDEFYDEEEPELVSMNCTLVVEDVTEDMKEFLLMFLENKKKGGGKYDWQEYDCDSKTLTVQFQEESVVQKLLALGTIKLRGKEFPVRPAADSTFSCSEGAVSDEETDEESSTCSLNEFGQGASNTDSVFRSYSQEGWPQQGFSDLLKSSAQIITGQFAQQLAGTLVTTVTGSLSSSETSTRGGRKKNKKKKASVATSVESVGLQEQSTGQSQEQKSQANPQGMARRGRQNHGNNRPQGDQGHGSEHRPTTPGENQGGQNRGRGMYRGRPWRPRSAVDSRSTDGQNMLGNAVSSGVFIQPQMLRGFPNNARRPYRGQSRGSSNPHPQGDNNQTNVNIQLSQMPQKPAQQPQKPAQQPQKQAQQPQKPAQQPQKQAQQPQKPAQQPQKPAQQPQQQAQQPQKPAQQPQKPAQQPQKPAQQPQKPAQQQSQKPAQQPQQQAPPQPAPRKPPTPQPAQPQAEPSQNVAGESKNARKKNKKKKEETPESSENCANNIQ